VKIKVPSPFDAIENIVLECSMLSPEMKCGWLDAGRNPDPFYPQQAMRRKIAGA
jgi:hypothetical protein